MPPEPDNYLEDPHDMSDHDDDSDVELSKLSPEEQERVLNSRLASGSNDKDARRLKRLLRNRVSAQQARERKKQYMAGLEDTIREQKAHISQLEGRLREVEQQNEALRNIVRSIRGMEPTSQTSPQAANLPQQRQQPQRTTRQQQALERRSRSGAGIGADAQEVPIDVIPAVPDAGPAVSDDYGDAQLLPQLSEH